MTPLSNPAVILSLCVLVNHDGLGGGETARTRHCDIVAPIYVLVNREPPVGGGGEKP